MGALCWGSYSGGIIQGQLSMVGVGGGGKSLVSIVLRGIL